MVSEERAAVAMSEARIDHVGFVVSNLERSQRWYAEVLNVVPGTPFEVAGTPLRASFASLGNAEIEFIEHREGSGDPFGLRNCDAGAFHFCVHVPDVRAAYAQLEAVNGVGTTPPMELIPDVFSFYLRDPDGMMIQVMQMGEGTGGQVGARFGDGLHHHAFTVRDLDRSLEWYRRVLTLSSGVPSTREGEIPSRTLEVPDSVFRQAMVPLGPSFIEIMEWIEPKGKPFELGLEDVGCAHLCVEVPDVVRLHDRLVREAEQIQKPLSALADGRRTFFLADPDGLNVQITGAA